MEIEDKASAQGNDGSAETDIDSAIKEYCEYISCEAKNG